MSLPPAQAKARQTKWFAIWFCTAQAPTIYAPGEFSDGAISFRPWTGIDVLAGELRPGDLILVRAGEVRCLSADGDTTSKLVVAEFAGARPVSGQQAKARPPFLPPPTHSAHFVRSLKNNEIQKVGC